MSNEKIERIISTYEPVEGMPGCVWINKKTKTYATIETLRSVYEDFYEKTGEIDEEPRL